jgi:hypothetical protein
MTSYAHGYQFYFTLIASYPERKLLAFFQDCITKGDQPSAAYWLGALHATRDLNNR